MAMCLLVLLVCLKWGKRNCHTPTEVPVGDISDETEPEQHGSAIDNSKTLVHQATG